MTDRRRILRSHATSIHHSQVVYPYARTREIVALLEEHITENIVKIGNEYYRQVVGIPQGSVLSAILCSFFYGDLEKRRMPDLREDGGSVSGDFFFCGPLEEESWDDRMLIMPS